MKHIWLNKECYLSTQKELIMAYEIACMRFSDENTCKNFAVLAIERCRQGGEPLTSIEGHKINSIKDSTLLKYDLAEAFDRLVTIPYDSLEEIKTDLVFWRLGRRENLFYKYRAKKRGER